MDGPLAILSHAHINATTSSVPWTYGSNALLKSDDVGRLRLKDIMKEAAARQNGVYLQAMGK